MMPKFFNLLLPAAALFAIFVLGTSTARENGQAVAAACPAKETSGNFEEGERIAIFEGRQIQTPDRLASFLTAREQKQVLGTESKEERWIEVDLSDQKLVAWDGDQVFLETKVSTGLPWWPTPTGEFRIWGKFRATKMEGGSGKYYYYLPNVPYVMFFENDQVTGRKGYGLHGTYWHNDFGTRRSHGCVNLPTPIAEKLFYWTTPEVPTGTGTARGSETNRGTKIVIHE